MFDDGFQCFRSGGLNRAVGLQKKADDCFEVFHVRPENNRLPSEGRLDWILAPVRGEAFPNKSNGGEWVPVIEFAGGVEQQDVPWFAGRQGGSADDFCSRGGEFFEEFGRSFHVPRRDD